MPATISQEVTITTLRTSVGEFTFRQSDFGCSFEVKVGKVRRVLGSYETEAAAVLALRNRRTGFHSWDSMGRTAANIQLDTSQRWSRKNGAR